MHAMTQFIQRNTCFEKKNRQKMNSELENQQKNKIAYWILLNLLHNIIL